MANLSTATTLRPEAFVAPFSRYLTSTVLYYTEKNLLTFETYKKTPIPAAETDQYIVITKGLEYRPDLLSYDVYGFPDLWWRILEANGIKDIWDFKAGANIRVPSSVF